MLTACDGREPSTTTSTTGGWSEPTGRYEYSLQSACGERLVHGWVRLTVDRGEVINAVGLDEAGRATVAAAKVENLPTLKALLAEYEQAMRGGADKATVQFDPEDGHPTRIDIDAQRNAIDDEVCYFISDYRVG